MPRFCFDCKSPSLWLQANPSCGWCDAGKNGQSAQCMIGDAFGPAFPYWHTKTGETCGCSPSYPEASPCTSRRWHSNDPQPAAEHGTLSYDLGSSVELFFCLDSEAVEVPIRRDGGSVGNVSAELIVSTGFESFVSQVLCRLRRRSVLDESRRFCLLLSFVSAVLAIADAHFPRICALCCLSSAVPRLGACSGSTVTRRP
jgi:hypothetical protein